MSRTKKDRARKGPPTLKERWLAWYANQGPLLLFGLKFGLSLALLYTLLSLTFFDRALYTYLEANAWLANAILRGLGQPTHVSEVTIQSPLFVMAIRRGCDAVEPTWLLCTALFAFPASMIQKVRGMLMAIILLQALNLVRIITLYWIGIHLPAFFNTAHVELWPTVFIIVCIVYFVSWKEWSHGPESPVAA